MNESSLVKAHQPCPDCGSAEEIWRDVPGYEGLYKVTSEGRVISYYKRYYKPLKQFKDKDGYLRVNLFKNKRIKQFAVHRLVAISFIANTECFPEVDHINGDMLDNRVCNLRWTNRKGNLNNPITHLRRTFQFEGEDAYKVAERNGINVACFRSRLRRGWPIQNACTLPLMRGHVYKGYRVKRKKKSVEILEVY